MSVSILYRESLPLDLRRHLGHEVVKAPHAVGAPEISSHTDIDAVISWRTDASAT